jgi:hypothetical protein
MSIWRFFTERGDYEQDCLREEEDYHSGVNFDPPLDSFFLLPQKGICRGR